MTCISEARICEGSGARGLRVAVRYAKTLFYEWLADRRTPTKELGRLARDLGMPVPVLLCGEQEAKLLRIRCSSDRKTLVKRFQDWRPSREKADRRPS